MQDLAKSFSYAVRSLRGAPIYSLAFVLTMGLAIGVNAVVFSVLRGLLLRELPHRNGERLVYLQQPAQLAGIDNALFSVPEIIDYRTSSKTLEAVAEYSAMTFTVLGLGEPRKVQAGVVTGNFFDVMGLDPVAGRVFDSRDDGGAAAPAMVLTHDYWASTFASDPGVVGTMVEMNGRTVIIAGVLELAPHYPAQTDVFVNMVTSPHHMSASMVHGRTHRMTEVFGRLAPGSTTEAAQTEVNIIARRLHETYPEAYDAGSGFRVSVTSLKDALTGRAKPTVFVLLATAVFVLVIACANVANLTLTRNIRRGQELAVRAALGGGGFRLRGMILTEHLVLAASGAALGWLLAMFSVDVLVAFLQGLSPRAAEVQLDWTVFSYMLGVAVGATVLISFVPRLPSGADLANVSRGTRSTGGTAGRRLQRAFVVAQLAVSVVLLVGAGLLLRTFLNLRSIDIGADLEAVVTMDVAVPTLGRSPAEIADVYELIRNDVSGIPGVTSAAVGSTLPLSPQSFMIDLNAEGYKPEPGRPAPVASFRAVTPDYFSTLGIPVMAGREFRTGDDAQIDKVVVINQTLANLYFPDIDPIGRHVAWVGDVLQFIGVSDEWRRIVGVVGDVKGDDLEGTSSAAVYQPMAQEPFGSLLAVRAAQTPEALIPAIISLIRKLESDAPVTDAQVLWQRRSEVIAPQRLNAVVIMAFSVLAIAIAAVGVAGVLGFSVSQRTKEIGIRLALGAEATRVRGMILKEGLILALAGVGVGAVAALASGRVVSGLLYGVSAVDPKTFVGVFALLFAITVAAAWVPAWVASRVEPVTALRDE